MRMVRQLVAPVDGEGMKRRAFIGLLVAAPVAAVAVTCTPPKPLSTGFYQDQPDLEAIPVQPPDVEVVEYWGRLGGDDAIHRVVMELGKDAGETLDARVISCMRSPFPAGRIPFEVIG